MPRKGSGGTRSERKRNAKLERGWNDRAFISPSRNNTRVHEVHRCYFDKMPGQLYGTLAPGETHVGGKHVSDWGGGTTSSVVRQHTRKKSTSKKAATAPIERDREQFVVVVHVMSTAGDRLPGARVVISAKDTGDVVGTAIADDEGRAVTVCRHEDWPAIPFHLEATSKYFAPAGLDFEATARECAAQITLESEADIEHREQMAALAEDEARRAARSRFIVHALVAHTASGRPISGATVVVRTAQNRIVAGSALTDADGKADVDCRHPQWASTPMRAEVTATGFVPMGVDLHPTGPDVSAVLRMEADEDLEARRIAEAAKFTVVVLARHRSSGRTITGASATLRVKATGEVLGAAETKADGKAVIGATHAKWSTTPMVLDVSGRSYVSVSGNVSMVAKAQQVEVALDLQSEVDAAAAAEEAKRKAAEDAKRSAADAAAAADAKAKREAEEAARRAAQEAARKRAEELERQRQAALKDSSFQVVVWCSNVETREGEEGCKVTISDRKTGEVYGTGVSDSEGRAVCACAAIGWNRLLMVVEAEKETFDIGVTNISPMTTPMTTRVHLEPVQRIRRAVTKDARDFSLIVYTFNESTDAKLPGCKVVLRNKSTGEELGSGVTGEDGICKVLGEHDEWASAAMYLHVSRSGFSSKGSDINLTSKEHRTDVGMVPGDIATAQRATRRQATLRRISVDNRVLLHTTVVDACTGEGRSNVEARLTNTKNQKVIATGTTDAEGSVQLSAGLKRWSTVNFLAECKESEGVGIAQSFKMTKNEESLQLVVVPLPDDGTVRAVLAWRGTAKLNFQMLLANGAVASIADGSNASAGATVHTKTAAPHGPQTIDLELGKADDWSRLVVVRDKESSTSIASVDASVTLLNKDGVIQRFKAPTASGESAVWDICALHARTGKVASTNYMVAAVPARDHNMRGIPAE